MSERNDRNRQVIEEFRANAAQIDGRFTQATLLLLTTTGAKSGRPFTTPVGYLQDGDRLFVFGSKGGGPANPDWYHNLKANPMVTVEVGRDKLSTKATEVFGEERDKLYARQVERAPVFGDYEKRTKRKIPVIALEKA